MFNRVQTVGTISEFMETGTDRELKRELKKFNKKAATHGFKATLTTLVTGVTAISITNNLFTNHAYASGMDAIPVVSIPGSEYVKGAAKEKIVEAFMPLVDMIQALSYPIALVMLTGGALMFMINQKDKGIGLIQNASIGYILVQLMPLLMNLLVGIGETVAYGVPVSLFI
ncbi:hypothetical protein [Evansella cellulosilytica]|uniref:Uncharacterized protein n=1 Tax=Evansella cellulosilytica (strain ATCC 21833 / DSM 2522 / FERM P-1141 / JCM 9156 / N-4) TaxID=649639 RepID=E6U1M3_EVAC2|nr:hypothetical protein [Evansella cellulosilytica]ADU30386.1 hypothetical protein Bcell_2125 [Evansella cellulosilytica DSM 2522]